MRRTEKRAAEKGEEYCAMYVCVFAYFHGMMSHINLVVNTTAKSINVCSVSAPSQREEVFFIRMAFGKMTSQLYMEIRKN